MARISERRFILDRALRFPGSSGEWQLNGGAGGVRRIDVRQRSLADFGHRSGRRRDPGSAGPTFRSEEPPADGWGWEAEVARFLEWKRADAAVGELWLRRMRWELVRFPRLLGLSASATGSFRPRDVTVEMVAGLRASLPSEKATFALHFAALRQFLAWAGNPVSAQRKAWSLPSGEPTHRRWLTGEQLRRLYRSSEGRARVLVALEGLNGLRRVEVLRLRAKDVALDEGCLLVLGKGRNGGKWRTVPVYPGCRAAIEGALAGTRAGDRLVPVSKSGADALLRKAADAAGLTQEGVRVSHHDLRRTFGRLAHAAGMDLIQLKNLYGHASVEMTVHYIGLDADTMRLGLERLSTSLGPLT